MPLYSYKCPSCGTNFTRFLRLVDYATPQSCECLAIAEKQLSAPAVLGDYAGYDCPITGSRIEGRRAHQENLARHGCRVLEPGEAEAVRKRKQATEDTVEHNLGETAAALVANLPIDKRHQLEREIQSGSDITVERL